MQPLLRDDDFAVIHQEQSYHVGEVVLYESQVLHRPVLHRIILIQNGNYFMKGDNNHFVDPGYATKSELLGALWFRIPEIGAQIKWMGRPVHAAVLASGGAALFIGTSTTSFRKRKRRRRHSHGARRVKSLTNR